MATEGFRTARELEKRAGGALFFVGFGTVWVLLSRLWLRSVPVPASVLAAVCGGVLFAWGWRFSARMERLAGPEPPVLAAEDVAAAKAFQWANIGQYVAMFLASVLLILLRRPEWIIAAIGLIVGLHLLPLAHWFRNPAHYVTAGLLMMWSLGLMIGLPRARVPGWAALGTGLILLGSASVTMLRASRAARRLGL